MLERTKLSRPAITQACVDSLAETLSIPKDQIDLNTKFSRMGLDSGMSVFLLLSLEERLGLTLVPDEIYENPTVAKLTERIATHHFGD